jgi:DNA-binding NarL/FixJ family response regulator
MRLMRKLGLTNNIDLVHYVIRRGLVPESSVAQLAED